MPADLIAIDALGPSGTYLTRNRAVVADTAGVPVADVTIVPPLYVARTIAAQRTLRPLPQAERLAALTAASDIFRNSVVAGLDFDQYIDVTSRVCGLPRLVALGSANGLVEALRTPLDSILPALPAGVSLDWRDGQRSGAVWARRGEVFAVQASGNALGIHAGWLPALALGYRVAVRPSRREPFTGHRLIHALREAGFRPADVVYLPTDHAGADELIAAADLAMVYGSKDVVDKYAGDPTVFINGPGRSKILITADQDWRDYLDVVVDSICGLGGMACVNASAVLYEGDPAPLAHAIGERLAKVENKDLPAQPLASARAIADHLAAKAVGKTPILGADQIVVDLGDGYALLRPAVHLLTRPDIELVNIELAFPCVWVAPWSRDDGLAPLRNSLVLNAITADEDLLDELIHEPTVRNIYSANLPTYHVQPHIPHDGFLADFLMENKGFVRGQ